MTTSKTLKDLKKWAHEDFQEELPSFMIYDKLAGDRYVDTKEVNAFLDSFAEKVWLAALDACREKVDGMDEQNHITQAILGALEYRGFYDAGKYLDGTIWERAKPLLLEAIDSLRTGGGKETV